ncbi:probable linoleate 9S-lipoxygenase 5 isoform X2 [Humulus lupulus]|nr:probable linoleate 9S-lipoxygenase 5 isoform X2 [Humulus lupulus]XP_062076533.1 probable linoleate 9S-lipoxygenase 5 isoform X2 [Humulus lupulus]
MTSKLDPELYGDQTSKITELHIKNNLKELPIHEALAKNKLFILDHQDSFMPYLRSINAAHTATKVYASRTLLFLKNDDTLKPIAIELSLPHPNGYQYGTISKVYTPTEHGPESIIWELAKAYVAVNDSAYHQLCSHWLSTHAVIEPFVIATHRQLSALHPIHKLVQPHTRGTMSMNALSRSDLINAGGYIESLFSQGKHAMEASAVVYKDWVFTEQALPADLLKRGLAVKDQHSRYGLRLIIEDYPYGEDGLDIWFAINSWVKDYCYYYYKSDDIVQKDIELQAWWKEIREVGHGDKKDEAWWPKMQTRDELVESCTILIWISSALHAAVNFGQYDFIAFFLNRPTLSRRFMPEEGSDEYKKLISHPEKGFLLTVTSKDHIEGLIDLLNFLSTHDSDEVYLNQRENPDWTLDTYPLHAFERFADKLGKIGDAIEKRNKDKDKKNRAGPVNFPYTFLIPTSKQAGITDRGIPNSISK